MYDDWMENIPVIAKIPKEECIPNNCEVIKNNVKLRTKINKLEKVIDLMAEDRAEISEPKTSKEAIINYYFKEVEEERYVY